MNKEINVVISLSDKIVSINALYRAGIKYVGRRAVPFIYKTEIAKKMGAQIMEALRSIDWEPHLDWLRETKYFTVTQNYVFKTGINRRDVENGSKGISDFVVKFIHDELGITTFDDSKFSDLHLYKNILPGSDNEYICLSIRPSTYEMRYDKLQKPQQALIHFEPGTKINSTELKGIMKEKAVSYQLCDTTRKIKEHDTNIFLLDSAGKNKLDLITGLYDYIYSRKDNTSEFTYYGFFQESDQDLVDKINSFGLSNVKAAIIKGGDVAGFIKGVL